MNAKETGVIVGVIVFLMLGVCFGAYQCGAAHTRDNIGVEGRAEEIGSAHTELGNEQRTNEKRLEQSTDLIERISDFTEKTNSDVRELWESNRRSGDLHSLLEQEVDILENYLVDMRRELDHYRRDGAAGNAVVEVGE